MASRIMKTHQLQNGVTEELEPLVGAEGEVAVAEGPVGEGSSQNPDVSELDADRVFEFNEFLKNRRTLLSTQVCRFIRSFFQFMSNQITSINQVKLAGHSRLKLLEHFLTTLGLLLQKTRTN